MLSSSSYTLLYLCVFCVALILCHSRVKNSTVRNQGLLYLERAALLANLDADDKCKIEVAAVRGIQALVILTTSCKFEGMLEQEHRALEALVQLTYSHHEGVRQQAAGALRNLSIEDKNREAITVAGGVMALA